MRIGIDISQTAYENTGVARYLTKLVEKLIVNDKENEYVLFFSSLRKKATDVKRKTKNKKNVTLKEYRIPPTLLDLMWNRLHVLPIEWFIGDVDVFITSDWTEPPVKRAKKVTILYDLIVYKHPKETAHSIVKTQKRKLAHVVKESDGVLCISESTKHDAKEILGIDEKKLFVTYPGI